MGLLDILLQGAMGGQGGAGSGVALTQAVLQMIGQGGTEGLTGLGNQFKSQGLGDIFSSWVSPGENKPISPGQLQQAMGAQSLQQLAGGAGMTLQAALPLLASMLPVIIDKLTPQGQLPQDNNVLQQGLKMLLGQQR